jgi:hypothetical protein
MLLRTSDRIDRFSKINRNNVVSTEFSISKTIHETRDLLLEVMNERNINISLKMDKDMP